jgi:hypothetical protein
MKINFSDMDVDRTFTIYPKGIYTGKVLSIEEVLASTGNTQLRVKFEIVDTEYAGSKITDHITLVDSCAWKVARFVNAAGINIKDLGSLDTDSGAFRNVLNRIPGKKMLLTVEEKPGLDGNMKNSISDYNQGEAPVDDAPEFIAESGPVEWDK